MYKNRNNSININSKVLLLHFDITAIATFRDLKINTKQEEYTMDPQNKNLFENSNKFSKSYNSKM